MNFEGNKLTAGLMLKIGLIIILPFTFGCAVLTTAIIYLIRFHPYDEIYNKYVLGLTSYQIIIGLLMMLLSVTLIVFEALRRKKPNLYRISKFAIVLLMFCVILLQVDIITLTTSEIIINRKLGTKCKNCSNQMEPDTICVRLATQFKCCFLREISTEEIQLVHCYLECPGGVQPPNITDSCIYRTNCIDVVSSANADGFLIMITITTLASLATTIFVIIQYAIKNKQKTADF
ncbi:hypothetical protein GJ496_010899 [Pomphorhynchus laevis]|nr:hypothetical protein GJ496_010899 [Pomphorhynchus laevis]